MRFSKGMQSHLLGSGSLKGALDGGFLYIYSGTVPAHADDAASGATLLAKITVSGGGTGLTFGTPVQSVTAGGEQIATLSKTAAETWSGTILATGTASFFRYVEASDEANHAASTTTAKRIQGTVGSPASLADLNLTSTSLTSGQTQNIDYFQITMPETA